MTSGEKVGEALTCQLYPPLSAVGSRTADHEIVNGTVTLAPLAGPTSAGAVSDVAVSAAAGPESGAVGLVARSQATAVSTTAIVTSQSRCFMGVSCRSSGEPRHGGRVPRSASVPIVPGNNSDNGEPDLQARHPRQGSCSRGS